MALEAYNQQNDETVQALLRQVLQQGAENAKWNDDKMEDILGGVKLVYISSFTERMCRVAGLVTDTTT